MDILIAIVGLVGATIFLFKDDSASREASMDIGFGIALLGFSIAFNVDVFIQIAAALFLTVLFIRKGFVRD
jgi:hypothetical protein